MLTAVSAGVAVVVCSTCRRPAGAGADSEGLRAGERLAQALHAAKAADVHYATIAVQTMPCLFACTQACTVHLRGPGRISYVMGKFSPDAAAARAILDFAAHYAKSVDGCVPYGDWPDGVMGHFITRSPPEGFVAD